MQYFNELVGHTIVAIKDSPDELDIVLSDGTKCRLYHEQNCCESVSIEEIKGDLQSLVGSPIIKATEEQSDENPPDLVLIPDYQDSFTWTTYHLATENAEVRIRWYGESNGWYSEDVYFAVTPPKE